MAARRTPCSPGKALRATLTRRRCTTIWAMAPSNSTSASTPPASTTAPPPRPRHPSRTRPFNPAPASSDYTTARPFSKARDHRLPITVASPTSRVVDSSSQMGQLLTATYNRGRTIILRRQPSKPSPFVHLRPPNACRMPPPAHISKATSATKCLRRIRPSRQVYLSLIRWRDSTSNMG